jgi:hypothetical protein
MPRLARAADLSRLPVFDVTSLPGLHFTGLPATRTVWVRAFALEEATVTEFS